MFKIIEIKINKITKVDNTWLNVGHNPLKMIIFSYIE